MLTHFQKWPLPGVKKTLMQGYTQRNKTKRKKEEKHKERETDRRREEDMTEGRSSFLRICMKMVLAAQRGKRCRRFESNTYQRQFWRARIPYLSRKTLEKDYSHDAGDVRLNHEVAHFPFQVEVDRHYHIFTWKSRERETGSALLVRKRTHKGTRSEWQSVTTADLFWLNRKFSGC